MCEKNAFCLGASIGGGHAMAQLAQWLIWPCAAGWGPARNLSGDRAYVAPRTIGGVTGGGAKKGGSCPNFSTWGGMGPRLTSQWRSGTPRHMPGTLQVGIYANTNNICKKYHCYISTVP